MLTLLEKVDILQKVPLFQGIRTESLARVAAVAQEAAFEPRQTLFRENDSPDSMFVVMEGAVTILRDGREIRKAGPTDLVGALALLAGSSQPESALAAGPVRTLKVDQQDFYDVLAEDFDVTRGILKALVGLAAGGA